MKSSLFDAADAATMAPACFGPGREGARLGVNPPAPAAPLPFRLQFRMQDEIMAQLVICAKFAALDCLFESPLVSFMTLLSGGLENVSKLKGLWKRDSVLACPDPPDPGALLRCTTDFVTPFRPAFRKKLNEINKSLSR